MLDVAIGEQIEAFGALRIVKAALQGHAREIVGQIVCLLLHVLLAIPIVIWLTVGRLLIDDVRRGGLLILIVVIVGVIVLIILIDILVVTLSVAVLHVVLVIALMIGCRMAGRFSVAVRLTVIAVVVIQQLLRLLLNGRIGGWLRMLIVVVLLLVGRFVMIVLLAVLVCRRLVGQVGMMTGEARRRFKLDW